MFEIIINIFAIIGFVTIITYLLLLIVGLFGRSKRDGESVEFNNKIINE